MAKYRRNWRVLPVAALALGIALGPACAQDDDAAKPPAGDPAWGMCARAAAKVEKQMGLPAHILEAISLAETGWSGPDRQLATWPWTVHDGSTGYHLASRQDAVKFVRSLRTDGQRSIDVGCMQINLRHHPRAFTSVSEGFDPEANMRYAASFLIRLKQQTGDWPDAVARYHSYNPTFYEGYETKVLAFWRRARAQDPSLAASGTTASLKPEGKSSNVASADKTLPVHSVSAVKIIRGMRPAPDRSAASMLVASAGPDSSSDGAGDAGPHRSDAAVSDGSDGGKAPTGLRRLFSSRR